MNNLDVRDFNAVENFLKKLVEELNKNGNYQFSDDERRIFFQIKNAYKASGSKYQINILLKNLAKIEINGVKIPKAESLTDEIQGFLIHFLHNANENLKIEFGEIINNIFEKLCDENIINDEDLKKSIKKILNNNIDINEIQLASKAEFAENLRNILNKDRKLSQNRIQNQNKKEESIFDGYLGINLSQNAGTSKIRFVTKKIRFQNGQDVNQYKKKFFVKENIIDKNDKGLVVGVMNNEKFREVAKKYSIRKYSFLLPSLMQYVQNLYNNYAYNSSNEELISKFIKIYDKESSYKIERIPCNDGSGLDIALVEFADKTEPIYKSTLGDFDKFSVKRSFIQIYDGDLNKFDEKSLFKAFQEAFIFGISDRINSGNFLEKTMDGEAKTRLMNIDFGQLFDFQHNLTVKKFCDCLSSGDIKNAKKIFLNVWKEELTRKLFMRKTAQVRPFLGIFFKKSRQRFQDLRLEMKIMNQICATLDHCVGDMSDEDFKKSFDFLLGEEKLNEATKIWNKFYEESGKYQVNSSGKQIRYNIPQGLSELNRALNPNFTQEKTEIKGRVKYWKENYFLTKFFISLAINISCVAAVKVIYDNFDKIKEFYHSSNDHKLMTRVIFCAFVLVAVLSILSTFYFGIKKSASVSEIFEKQSIEPTEIPLNLLSAN
jgi:hypothetical protein